MSLIYTSTSSNVKTYCSYSRTTWEINILFISKSCNPSTNLKNIIKRFYTYFLFCLIKISFFSNLNNPTTEKRGTQFPQQLAHITWWKKKFTSAVTSEVIAMASESIVRTSFLFGWDCFIAAVQLNDKSKPPSNSTLEMRIFI